MSKPSSGVAEHFNSPRNAGEMENPDAVGESSLDGRAPRINIFLKSDGRSIEQATFQAFGCGYSIAACSVLTVRVTGRTLAEAAELTMGDILAELGGVPVDKEFCADLAVKALQDGLSKLHSGDN